MQERSESMDSASVSHGLERLQPLLGVGLRQPKAAAVLVDLEAHFAAVNFCDTAELQELLRKTPQPLFQRYDCSVTLTINRIQRTQYITILVLYMGLYMPDRKEI